MKKNAVVYAGNDAIHLSQVYAGFGMLEQEEKINVSIKAEERNRSNLKSHLRCEFEGCKIVFDLHDRITYVESNCYTWCDFYFKRSVNADMIEKYPKIKPWGLNVIVTCSNNMLSKRLMLMSDTRQFLKAVFSGSPILGRLFKLKNAIHITDYRYLQQAPVKQDIPKVLFIPRLWDDTRVSGTKRDEWMNINKERILLVELLRKNFPSHFIGGIEANDFSLKYYPNLVLPKKFTYKANYFQLLRNSSIGISSPGLAGSIPWKFSEYLMFSKAVVSNNIDGNLLNAPLISGQHYLPYQDPQTMLESVEELVRNVEFRNYIMQQNYSYSQEYLNPAKQLNLALGKCGIIL